MFCNNCGAQLPNGTKFCNYCGSAMVTAPISNEYEQTYSPVQTPDFPAPPPPKKSNTPLIITAVVAVLLVIVVIVAAILITDKQNDSESKKDTTTSAVDDTQEKKDKEDKSEKETQEEKTERPDSGNNSDSNTDPSPSMPVRGTLNGDIYYNSFADITFTKPANWRYASDDELAELVGLGADQIGYSEFEQTILEETSVFDMMACAPAGYPNLMLMFENLDLTGSSHISEEDYADIISSGLIAQDNLNYTINDLYETELGGYTYTVLDMEANVSGVTVHQRYYIRKKGDFMIGMIATVYNESDYSTIEDMFSATI